MVAYKERAPNVYRAKFVKLDTDYKLIDRESGEEVTRWRWVFEDLTSNDFGDLDTITSPGFRARSNGLKLFTGMLGRAPTEADDTDQHIGKVFNVVYGPNQNGRNTVTGVVRIATDDNFVPAETPQSPTAQPAAPTVVPNPVAAPMAELP
jgi:hypothetical protein